MRFCPFCSAENADELTACATCGRRLPPLPPRRANRNAPPTGVQVPPRAPMAGAPRPAAPTSPPPPPTVPPASRSGWTMPPPVTDPAAEPTAPTLAPPPGLPAAAVATTTPRVSPPADEHGPVGDRTIIDVPDPRIANSSLRHAISPGPAAQRREAPPASTPDPHHARRREDAPAQRSAPFVAPSRAKPPSIAPPVTPPVTPPVAAPAVAPPVTPADARPAERPRSSSMAPLPGVASGGVRGKAPTQPPPTPAAALESGRARAPSIPPAIPSVTGAARGKPVTMPPRVPAALGVTFDDDFNTVTAGQRFDTSEVPVTPAGTPPRAPLPPPITPEPLAATPSRSPTGIEPPPTRIHRPEALADRPFTPPKVDPIPEIPEPGLVNASKYALRFGRARWQRRGAIKTLGADIKQDTEALDQVLGALGRAARGAKVDGRVFSAENTAITSAEERVFVLGQEHEEVDGRKAEENSKFVDVERERNAKLGEAEKAVEETQKELAHLEAQRRGARDKRKELERRQRAYLKAAEDSEKQAGNAQMGDTRQELRRAAEQHRKEAAALEPERQDIDRRLAALERPIGEATARLDAAKAELDAAKRSLADAREGHLHRLAELDAEQKRKAREIALAESEIARRLVTLGTLVNLNRIEDPQFRELYDRIDRLRGAITARTTEIEKLTAEREAYDRGTLVRGVTAIGGAIVLFIALIVILLAVV